MAEDDRKAALTAELARARSHIAGTAQSLRHDLDVPARLRRSFARHPAIWIGCTAVAGLALSRLLWPKNEPPSRRKTPEPEIEKLGKAGLLLGALKVAFNIARPVLIPWATRRFAEYLSAGKTGGSSRP